MFILFRNYLFNKIKKEREKSIMMTQTWVSSSIQNATINTKLMQNYRLASKISPNGICGIINEDGNIELFTIGSDNSVWNIYSDPYSDTGYNIQWTEFSGGSVAIASGRDNDGRMIVFSAIGNYLFYMYKFDEEPEWTNRSMEFPSTITKIIVRNLNGNMCVNVCGQGGNNYIFYQFNPESSQVPGSLYSEATAVLVNWKFRDGYHPAVMSINCNGDSLDFEPLDITTEGETYVDLGEYTIISADSSPDGSIYAILSDGLFYKLILEDNNYGWINIPTAGISNLKKIYCIGNEIFSLSNDYCLYHWMPDPNIANFIKLRNNVADLCITLNNNNDIEFFIVEQGNDKLLHQFRRETGTDWTTEEITVEKNDEGNDIKQYISYCTDVVLCDNAGKTLSHEEVNLMSKGEAILNINGVIYFLNPNNPVTVKTDANGLIAIAKQTDSLADPIITIDVPVLNSTFTIDQSYGVKNYLANIKDNDVANAKDSEGNYLLGDTFRTPDTISAITNSCNNLMNLPLSACHARVDTLGNSSSMLQSQQENFAEKHWKLSFYDNKLIYEELNAEDARELLNDIKRYKSSNGLFDVLGDLVESAENGIANITQLVISGTEIGISFFVDTILYNFNCIIDTIEQAFDVVECIWEKVKVPFEKMFEWLGFLFDWDDIKRTQKVIAHAINQIPDFISGAAEGIKSLIDNNITEVQAKAHNLIETMIQDIGSNTFIGYVNSNQPNNTYTPYLSNNIMMQGFTNNAGKVMNFTKESFTIDPSIFESFFNNLEQFENDQYMTDAFKNAQTYFSNIFNSGDSIITNTLSGLLSIIDGLVQAGLAGFKMVIDSLLQLAADVVSSIMDLMNRTLDIPFVSQLYKYITGSDLCMTDLIALIIAIPSTVMCKVLSGGQSPFPDDESVQAFTNSYSSSSLLQASGLVNNFQDPISLRSTVAKPIMSTISAISQFFYADFTILCDMLSENCPLLFSIIACTAEFGIQAFSCPWYFESGLDWTNAVWIYESLGVLGDVVWVVAQGKIPDNWGDAGIVYAIFYGIFNGIVALIEVAETTGEFLSLDLASNLLISAPSIFKAGLFKSFVTDTGGISMAITCSVDKVSYYASAIIDIYLAWKESSNVLLPQNNKILSSVN